MPTPTKSSTVAAFYYAWYGGPLGPSRYHPTLNPYDVRDPATIRRHIDQMRYGGIQAAIASWWGPGHMTDDALGLELTASEGTPFKWSVYYELEGPGFPNPSVEQLRASLQYLHDRYVGHPHFLRVDGRPVVFVWPDGSDRCDMLDDHFGIQVKPWSYSVGPGFWKSDEAPRLARDPAAFETAVRGMATSPAMWKLVTTFNEWREGTAVEPAEEWASPSG